MDNNYSVIRCPKCGGVHLTGVVDQKNLKKTFLWSGLIGIAIDAIKRKNNDGAYWQCTDCGYTFKMD